MKIAVESVKREGIDPDKKHLTVRIKIDNQSSDRHTYSSWQSKYYSSGDLLTDDLENSYDTIPSKTVARTIKGGEAIEDTLVFEKPNEKAKSFNLFLYPRAFTYKQPLQFKFDAPK